VIDTAASTFERWFIALLNEAGLFKSLIVIAIAPDPIANQLAWYETLNDYLVIG
jgi:hypothetical protein